MVNERLRVQDLGEQRLLKRLQEFCPIDVIGDDAALLSVEEGHSLVVTTDMLVDGVHFSDRTTSPIDAGWRAVAANLSDLAAMGATPLGITIGLGLPGAVNVTWVEQFYQGVTACLQPFKAPILGGDLCGSPIITVSITALGQVLPHRAIRRSCARVGDAIVVTGVHGASRAGLELLLHPRQGQDLSADERAVLIQSHQRPKPRLDAVSVLWETWDSRKLSEQVKQTDGVNSLPPVSADFAPADFAPADFAPAGMDSSDGLADAVLQICRASRVGAQLERNLIPFVPCLTAWVSEAQAIDWALYGGEDFELVLCLPRAIAQTLVDRLGKGAAIVGTITADPKVVLKDSSGIYADEILSLAKGFQHFG